MTGPKNALADRVLEASEDRGREAPVEPVTVQMGQCECPGRPHVDGDVAQVRSRLHYGRLRRVLAAYQQGDPGDGELQLMLQGIVSWNLTTRDAEGADEPLEVTRATVEGLTFVQSTAILRVVDGPGYLANGASIPNAPGGPSASGPAASGSSGS